MVEVNYLAILVTAVLTVFVGGLWYGPVFGKQWMAMVGITVDGMKSMKMTPVQAMVGGFVGALLTSFILAHHIVFAGAYMQTTGLELGLMSGFFIWLGFYVPVTAGVVLWEGKPWKLFLLNASYYLVTLLVAGAVLSLWV